MLFRMINSMVECMCENKWNLKYYAVNAIFVGGFNAQSLAAARQATASSRRRICEVN